MNHINHYTTQRRRKCPQCGGQTVHHSGCPEPSPLPVFFGDAIIGWTCEIEDAEEIVSHHIWDDPCPFRVVLGEAPGHGEWGFYFEQLDENGDPA